MSRNFPDQDPNDQLWSAIVSPSADGIAKALANGANANKGPSEHIRWQYPECKFTEELLPLSALFMQSDRSRGYYDQHHMDYKAACKTLLLATDKARFGVENGTTPLIEYARIVKNCQRHALFMQILRRTPKQALNTRDARGFSALDHALSSGLMQSVKALLVAGADPDDCNIDGENALFREGMLLRSGGRRVEHPTFLFALLKHGAKVRDNVHGMNYLHLDTSAPLSTFDLSGVDLNSTDDRGRSLAQCALERRSWTRLNELMDAPGVDWLRQIPDPEELKQGQHLLSDLDNTGRLTMTRLQSHLLQGQLDQSTQSSHARPAVRRF